MWDPVSVKDDFIMFVLVSLSTERLKKKKKQQSKSSIKQEYVCKTGHAPPMLLCHSHFDLDLYAIGPKIDREHLLSMTNVCMKFEKAGLNQNLVINQTKLYIMDRQTKGQTDAKQYTPSASSSKGGI